VILGFLLAVGFLLFCTNFEFYSKLLCIVRYDL
jgi:hypothetical protein